MLIPSSIFVGFFVTLIYPVVCLAAPLLHDVPQETRNQHELLSGGGTYSAINMPERRLQQQQQQQQQQQHAPSVGEILLDMVRPGTLTTNEKIGVTTVSRVEHVPPLPHQDSTTVDNPETSSAGGSSSGGSSGSGVEFSSSSGGVGGSSGSGTGGGVGGGAAVPLPSAQETAVVQKVLEEAWAERSLFRPRTSSSSSSSSSFSSSSLSPPPPPPPLNTPATAVQRLPQQPPALLASLRQERGHHPLDPKTSQKVEEGRSNGNNNLNINMNRPLLALLHPASLAWPARLDVLVTVSC
jgi:hypothetical protein